MNVCTRRESPLSPDRSPPHLLYVQMPRRQALEAVRARQGGRFTAAVALGAVPVPGQTGTLANVYAAVMDAAPPGYGVTHSPSTWQPWQLEQMLGAVSVQVAQLQRRSSCLFG